MGKFFKSYIAICKKSIEWEKTHWKGVLVFNIFIFAILAIMVFWETIYNKTKFITTKFKKVFVRTKRA